MATGHKAQVSALQLHWVDSTHAMVGFTVSYDDGSIENHLRPCTQATLPAITREMNSLREHFLHHSEEE
jgi:hypothetical protein